MKLLTQYQNNVVLVSESKFKLHSKPRATDKNAEKFRRSTKEKIATRFVTNYPRARIDKLLNQRFLPFYINYYSFKIFHISWLGQITQLIIFNKLALAKFESCEQYTSDWMVLWLETEVDRWYIDLETSSRMDNWPSYRLTSFPGAVVQLVIHEWTENKMAFMHGYPKSCSSCLEEKSPMVPNPDPKQYSNNWKNDMSLFSATNQERPCEQLLHNWGIRRRNSWEFFSY